MTRKNRLFAGMSGKPQKIPGKYAGIPAAGTIQRFLAEGGLGTLTLLSAEGAVRGMAPLPRPRE